MPSREFAAATMTDDVRGRRLGRYELCAKIADGGMAEVYVGRVVDGVGAGDVVAIKTIREQFGGSREFVTMFLDEAKIVSRLRHRNVIRYHDFGTDGEQLFLAMELLYGQSLWTMWEACRARRVRLRYEMVAWIGARVADGLHYAHELVDEAGRPLDIVHRDVNAANIFVTYDGEVKVIDFGLAKAENRASKTAAGVIKGKVAYMSPEQAKGGAVDRRTDVFALGTTLWEICCDRRLFKRGDDVETLRRVHAAEVPDPRRLVDGFPAELWRVLRRALARDPDQRYATAADLARDLDAVFPANGVDAIAVGTVMKELFAEDQARQVAWVAEVSAPTRSHVAVEPLKPPSTFWSGDVAAGPPPPAPEEGASPEPAAPRVSGAAGKKPSAHLRAPAAFAVFAGVLIAIVAALVIAFIARR